MASLAATWSRISSNAAARYLIAAGAAIVAIGARWALNPLLGDYLPYATLYPAVAFAAWFCGVGPSALLTILGMLGLRYLFIFPKYSLSIPDGPQTVGMLVFAAGAAAIIAAGEVVRPGSGILHLVQDELETKSPHET